MYKFYVFDLETIVKQFFDCIVTEILIFKYLIVQSMNEV